jgi:MFS family permease
MREEQGGAIQKSAAAEANGAAAVQWQRTLWVMVGIQFIMTGAFSVLSPIMPLLLPELGVETASAVDLWAGILNGVTSFVAAFASPVWGRVADRRGRKLMLLRSTLAIGAFTALMGLAANIWQFFAFRALMGRSPVSPARQSRWWRARSPKGGSALRWAGSAPASSLVRWWVR